MCLRESVSGLGEPDVTVLDPTAQLWIYPVCVYSASTGVLRGSCLELRRPLSIWPRAFLLSPFLIHSTIYPALICLRIT